MQTTREALNGLLASVQEVEDSVVRGERKLGQRTYAIAFVDLADDVVRRYEHLRDFQERILGDEFFGSPDDLRWNKYLYIVAGPQSLADPHFAEAKAAIEADRDYARKRVVSPSDLETLLGGSKLFAPVKSHRAYDVIGEWERRLSAKNLDLLLDCPKPRTSAIDAISKGIAARTKGSKAATKALSSADKRLVSSKIRQLEITKFRPVHDGKRYEFGDVTLIVGANGTGKTSLLEAVEYFYCGHNRRSKAGGAISIKASLQELGDEATFEHGSTTEAARLKARCMAWYNRNEHNASAIVDSFSQYNFLDTDAAFRLSGSLEPGDVSRDLSHLLVGPTAATTFEYFEKIRGDVEKALLTVRRDIAAPKELLATLEKSLKDLQSWPSTGRTLLDSYRSSLASIGWRQVSQDPNPDPAEGERLLNALSAIQILANAGDAALTITDIRRREAELKAAFDGAAPFGNELTKLIPKEKVFVEQISNHEATIGNLQRWMLYETSGFNALRRDYPAARKTAGELSGLLGNYMTGELPSVPLRYAHLSVRSVLALGQQAVEDAEKRAAQSRDLVRVHELAASNRASVAANLKVAALAALQASQIPDTCPVCKTTHAAGTLLQLIDELTESEQGSAELAKLVEARRLADEEVAKMAGELSVVMFVDGVADALSMDSEQTPPQILEALVKLRQQASAAQATLQLVVERGKSLNQAGFTSAEADLLWGHICSLFVDETVVPTADALTEALRLQEEALVAKRAELAIVKKAIDVANEAVQRFCKQVEVDGWETNVPLVNSTAALAALCGEFSATTERIDQLCSLMAVGDDFSLAELQSNLTATLTAFRQAEAAMAAELAGSTELQELPIRIAAIRLKIESLENEEKAYQNAATTLDEIFAHASLKNATTEALAEIGTQINEVFSRIHAPREYEYVGSDEALLRTARGHQKRELNEVSTGQRAAFALSIFLARNRTATAAPPVMLIDDPIAHIDDLNALSFLDYLRDISINSGRQIFFATADTRIASLFSKKFSFLGQRFRTISLVRAHESDSAV
ncbi:AAA family ATPase [Achromobacter mucicolens]|uniref:AAA family ATPase n=1 Tax=Achromobacter mucicolens TaxID=1389922 RepID=UPI001582455E|nr:AAA family ATPase [Achromobacter mucicolens]